MYAYIPYVDITSHVKLQCLTWLANEQIHVDCHFTIMLKQMIDDHIWRMDRLSWDICIPQPLLPTHGYLSCPEQVLDAGGPRDLIGPGMGRPLINATASRTPCGTP